MGKTVEVTCDACEADLTYTGNSVDYRLVVGTESKAPWYVREGLEGGVLTDFHIDPPVKRTRYFCSLACLAHWIAPRMEGLLSRYERQRK